jgi:hypothetical protein
VTATATQTKTRRILVVANERVEATEVRDAVRFRARKTPDAEVLLIAPASVESERAAELRVAAAIERLRTEGLYAEGLVMEADPSRAIDEALALFDADEIVIATSDKARTNEVVRTTRLRHAKPIFQVAAPP